jgi:MFS family permease
LQAGLAFVLPTIVCTVGIRWAERGLARHSARIVLMAGWTAGLAGLVWTAALLPLAGNYWWLVPGFIVMSIGQGASWTGMWVLVGEGIAPQQRGGLRCGGHGPAGGAALGLAVLVMVAAGRWRRCRPRVRQVPRRCSRPMPGSAECGMGHRADCLLALLVCALMGRRPLVHVLKPQLAELS